MTRTLADLRANAAEVKACGLTDRHNKPLRLVVKWPGEIIETEWVLTSGGRYAPTGSVERTEA